MYTDPIADMLTRIRNAQKARKLAVRFPGSRVKRQILEVLAKHSFVGSITEEKSGAVNMLLVELPTDKELNIKRVSKPGQRIYVQANELKSVKNGLGIAVVSTSQGMMTNSEARKKGIGGEIICELY